MSEVFKISDAASLAFHAMAFLAEDPGRMLQTKEIAARFQVSENHLSKVLQRLTKSGLIKAVRGPHGGFQMDKDPNLVTLLNVYEAIEGPLETTNCLLGSPVCGWTNCVLGNLLRNVNGEIKEYLTKTRLGDLVAA